MRFADGDDELALSQSVLGAVGSERQQNFRVFARP